MKHSKLHEYIMMKAEERRKSLNNSFVTVEDIFSSFLKFYRELGITVHKDEFDGEEVKKVCAMIRRDFDFSHLSDYEQILTVKKPEPLDEIIVEDVLRCSEEFSAREKKECITADILLDFLLKMPSDRMWEVIISPEKIRNMASSEKKKSDFDFELTDRLIKEAEAVLFGDKKKNSSDEEDDDEEGETDWEAEFEDLFENEIDYKETIISFVKKAKEYQDILRSKIFGQDNAINTFVSGYFQAKLKEVMQEENEKPVATFLFAGPPGVGKTLLASEAADMLGLPFKRFDMSEYAFNEAVVELCGIDKAYRAAHEGALTKYVKENPNCVLLFDELEKAHINAIHLFLQILDSGKLGDLYTKQDVDFSKTIIFFTTNAARKLYEDSETANLSGVSKKAIIKALETDVDPSSGARVFPAAICSRLATGNVVLFNHMEAHSLRAIAEKELMCQAMYFEATAGIKCNISDDVYSCILFAEGGNADARTTVGRAKNFFSTEIYELLRLASETSSGYNAENIENISIDVEIPDNEKIRSLFKDESKGRALLFGSDDDLKSLNDAVKKLGYDSIVTDSLSEAEDIAKKQDIDVVFCDFHKGQLDEVASELNVEDIESDGRTFFRYVCENTDIPIYLVFDNVDIYSDAELFSLTKEGCRGMIDFCHTEDIVLLVADILRKLHHQKSMITLAKSNKLVTYETAQTISEDGKSAKITLFDLALETCVEAEDVSSVLSNLSKPDVKFEQIIGNEEAKIELKFFVEYLRNPKKLSSKGLAVPKGVLFYGPPGTGKTMLAKAAAGEAGVTFICTEGNKFFNKYVGESEAAVHRLFATARKYAPAIIFIDEIDAIAKERTGSEFTHTTESVLTAFLSEMDGFKTNAKKPVFVLAATNFNVEPGTSKSLDGALLRRFDRHIYIDLPDKEARIKFINKKVEDRPVFKLSAEEIENVAVRSTGMSLAVLESIFEFSLRIAIRADKDYVDDEVFEEAFETHIYGKEKKWDADELEKTAYHEAGHAFLCWHSGEIPSYLTIVARGNHGGYMHFGDNEKRGSYTKNMLLSRIRIALGGRASELVFFGNDAGMTTGASSDLKKATSIAKDIVCNYGMDDELGLAVFDEKDFSDSASAQQIRSTINKILNEEMSSAKEILAANSKAIKKIVEKLLQKNHLNSVEIDKIFSKYAKQLK